MNSVCNFAFYILDFEIFMCGIAAIFAYHYVAPEVNREELRLIRDAMASRGPDGVGEWFSENGKVGLGHRRLSIIDLSPRGAQPMQTEDGKIVVSFNGEIYNYRELRSDLENKGRIFRSNSDTEVLLHLYQLKGQAMVHDLRGMFAFTLWDGRKNSLFLARDPYGIKPLYYADDGWTVRVASQVKALLKSDKVSKLAEPAGTVGFFLMGSVPEPYTLYQEIRQVPAGSYVWVDELGPSSPKRYFSIAEILTSSRGGRRDPSLVIASPTKSDEAISGSGQAPQSGSEIASASLETPPRNDVSVHSALLDSVRHHFVSDVPVGIFLSGGIDSGSLVSLARETGIQDLQTMTLAFEEFYGGSLDEMLWAETAARKFGTRHTSHTLTENEFKKELPHFFESMDQPTIDGVNTYFISKAAHESGLKVALSGLGGDELFGGYSTFQDIPRLVGALAFPSRIPFLGDGFRHLFSIPSLRPKSLHPKYAGLLKYGASYSSAYFLRRGLFMPWELDSVMGKEMVHEGLNRLQLLPSIKRTLQPEPKDPFAKVATLESSLYMRNQLLRDTDWAGMAHSLEVRTPFVDSTLLKKLVPFLVSENHPHNAGKKILTGSLSNPLPGEITRRAKTGFSVPVEKWLEKGGELDMWQRIPSLQSQGTPWARRWAYVVMSTFNNAVVKEEASVT